MHIALSSQFSLIIHLQVNKIDGNAHDESYKTSNSNVPVQPAPTLSALRASPKQNARRDSRPAIPQLHLQSISAPTSFSVPNSISPANPVFSSSHYINQATTYSSSQSPRDITYSPRVGSLSDSPRVGMIESSPRTNERYGVAFGIKVCGLLMCEVLAQKRPIN